MKNKEINNVFKQVLKTFVKEMINPCETFIANIEECETYYDLKDLLEENADSIFEKLGGDCEICDEKDNEIKDLTDAVCCLKNENDDMEIELKDAYIPRTLDDEYKLEAFKKSKDNFNVSEFESLLD